MTLLGQAIALAAEAFKNTTDKGGQPYILHCLRVMDNLHTKDEELKCIAVLHDYLEDIPGVDFMDLYKEFTPRIVQGIRLLTHDKSISYEDYIKLISTNEDARLVKLADLKDNSDISRLKGLTKSDFDRAEKYFKAYTYLSKI